MSIYRIDRDDAVPDDLNPRDGWGEVPETDRPLWSRYMLDYCPWFPGPTIMSLIAGGIVDGGTRAPQPWKDAAAELHSAGFTPLHYYLLAALLCAKRKQGELDEASHGHLFKQWFEEPLSVFQLDAEAWRPWLEALEQAQSPGRALDHMLYGPNLPPLGAVVSINGKPARVISD